MEIAIEDITCPITGQIFCKPVVAADTFTYEREAIECWIAKNSTSPLTNKSMSSNLVENRTLENIIINIMDRYPEKKKEQYKYLYEFDHHERDVKKFIRKNEYEELLNYINFDCTKLKLNAHIKKIFDNCQDNEILIHFIDNTSSGEKELLQSILLSSASNEIIHHALKCIDDLDIVLKHGQRPIHYAIKKGEINLFNYIVSKNIDIDKCDDNGNNLLHYLAMNFNKSIADKLMDKRININGLNKKNQTPLLTAINYKNKDSIMYLLANGADINIPDIDGKLPIHYSIIYLDNVMCPDFMPYFSKQYNIPTNKSKYPIHYACKYSSLKAIKILLESKIDLQVTDHKNFKPIHYIAIYGNKDEISYILNTGAEIDDIVEFDNKNQNFLTLLFKNNKLDKENDFIKEIIANKKIDIIESLRLLSDIEPYE